MATHFTVGDQLTKYPYDPAGSDAATQHRRRIFYPTVILNIFIAWPGIPDNDGLDQGAAARWYKAAARDDHSMAG